MNKLLFLFALALFSFSLPVMAANDIAVAINCQKGVGSGLNGLDIQIEARIDPAKAVIVPLKIKIIDSNSKKILEQADVGNSTPFEKLEDPMHSSLNSISSTINAPFSLLHYSFYRMTIDQNKSNSKTTYNLGLGTSECPCMSHAISFEGCTFVSDIVKKKFAVLNKMRKK